MSWALFGELRAPRWHEGSELAGKQLPGHWVESDDALFSVNWVYFWTEHSDRNWLSSMAAVRGYSKTERQRLGGWGGEPSEEYVRTSKIIVLNIQKDIAQWTKNIPEDEIGEEDVLAEYASYLTSRSEEPEKVEAQIRALRFLDPKKMTPGVIADQAWEESEEDRDDPLGYFFPAKAKKVTGKPPPGSPMEQEVRMDQEADESQIEVEFDGCLEMTFEDIEEAVEGTKEYDPFAKTLTLLPVAEPEDGTQMESNLESASEAVSESDSDDGVPRPGLVIAISQGRRQFRRLHRYGMEGGCHRVPGVDYKVYEKVDPAKWAEVSYDDHCHQCWRNLQEPEETVGLMDLGSDSSDSPSSNDPTDSEPETEVTAASSSEAVRVLKR